MKKINLLIPALVAVTASPFIGLTSCFENEEDDPKPGPTPPAPTDYTVTQDEMESAIQMKGVEYLQMQQESSGYESDTPVMTERSDGKLAPNVHSGHGITEFPDHPEYDMDQKVYAVNDNGTCIQYSKNEGDKYWSQNPIHELLTIQKVGGYLYDDFYDEIGDYSKFNFDPEEKCYTGSISEDEGRSIVSFYFKNKKLIHIVAKDEYKSASTIMRYDFAYEHITPESPVPSNIVLNVCDEEHDNILRTEFWYYDLEPKEYEFKINISSWGEGKPENPTSYSFSIVNYETGQADVTFSESFSFTAHTGSSTELLAGHLDVDSKNIIFDDSTQVKYINQSDYITCRVTISSIKDNNDYFIFSAFNDFIH